MKIIFFGTPDFAASILHFLVQKKINITAIVCQPDRKLNKRVHIPPVKKTAKSLLLNADILQPEKASNSIFIENLKKYKADLFVVVAYGQILKQDLLDIPKLGCINVHASLLPKYRGANPIRHTLLNGDDLTGITIQKMALKMDAGGIISQAIINIDDEMDFGSLEDKMLQVSKPLLLEVLKGFKKNNLTFTEQDESKVTYASKLKNDDLIIDFNKKAFEINNQIRALSPKPGAYFKIKILDQIKNLKVYKSKILNIKSTPYQIINQKESFIIGTKDFALELLEVQMEGKNKLHTNVFLRGLKAKISINN
ncbi:MAG: Methionyl-tRNA formyltransferase [Candidatus Anoxychlamydiales bacterium]|nr:Methionyl-tRNA formyltransferase [Candidatus Anoxychlamydiales bacterium]